MLRSAPRAFPVAAFLFTLVAGVAALAYQSAPADAQTVSCYIRVCSEYENGDKTCVEKKVDCAKLISPSTPA